MSETIERVAPVQNLKRIGEKKFRDYAAAAAYRQSILSAKEPAKPKKVKIFARWDGSFDVVGYDPIDRAPVKAAPAPERAPEPQEQKVHGLKSKDRKKSPKKS
jgi:hypothetical protein